MGRLRWISAALVLVAACGSGGAGEAASLQYGPATVAGTVEQVDGVAYAPDFTVVLDDGSTFDTTQIDTPLYIIFLGRVVTVLRKGVALARNSLG